jgi:hypothetical protein
MDGGRQKACRFYFKIGYNCIFLFIFNLTAVWISGDFARTSFPAGWLAENPLSLQEGTTPNTRT